MIELPTISSISVWPHGRVLSWYLMCSYLYYCLDFSAVSDDVYDAMAKKLLSVWDDIDHPHKYLISKEDLAAGTLYGVSSLKYPLMIKNAAERVRDAKISSSKI